MIISDPFFLSDLWKTCKEDHTRIIPSKFGQNPYNKWKRESVIRWKNGSRKRIVTDHNSSCEITSDPLEGAIFYPIAVIWIILIKVYYMKLHTKYRRLVSSSFHTSFSLYETVLNKWPLCWGHFWPQGYNFNNFGSGPLDEATYQISKESSTSSLKHHMQ